MYNRTCPTTLPTNGSVFSWSPRATSPRRSPLARTSWQPPNSLPVSVPCPLPLPIPWSCFEVRSHPIGQLAVIGGTWVNPHHGRGPRDQVTALENRGTFHTWYISCLVKIIGITLSQNINITSITYYTTNYLGCMPLETPPVHMNVTQEISLCLLSNFLYW